MIMKKNKSLPSKKHWKSIFGVEYYKIDYWIKKTLYNTFGITLPKLKSQDEYWQWRGEGYFDEIMSSGYLEREVFFQNLIMNELANIEFQSAFEAGCGFGWNIRRVKELFPHVKVGCLDFSKTQLEKGKDYMAGYDIETTWGDACNMPFPDNSFDVGFTLGVFMNLHPEKISLATKEMARVCNKYIIHVEYVEKYATPELIKKRAFKTNIVSHDYEEIYASLGVKPLKVLTYKDFGNEFRAHEKSVDSTLNRWEGFEGSDKYVFYLFEV